MSDQRRVNFRESSLSSGASSRFASDSGAGSVSDYPGSSAAGVGSNVSSRYSNSDRTAFAGGHDHASHIQWNDFATLEKAFDGAITSKDQWKLRAQNLEADVRQLEKELKDSEAKRHETVSRLKQQADDAREQSEDKMKKLEEENRKLSRESRENKASAERAAGKIDELEDEVVTLRQKLAEANARCNELQCNLAPPFSGAASPGNAGAMEMNGSRISDKKASSGSSAAAGGGGSGSREGKRASSTKGTGSGSGSGSSNGNGNGNGNGNSTSNSNSTTKISRTSSKHDGGKDNAKEQKKRLSQRFDHKDDGGGGGGSKSGDSNSNASSSSSASSSSHRQHGGSNSSPVAVAAHASANGASHHGNRQGSNGSNGSGGSIEGGGQRQPRQRRQSFVEPFGPGGHSRAGVSMPAAGGALLKGAPPRAGPAVMPGPGAITGHFQPFSTSQPYFNPPQSTLVSPRGDVKLIEGIRPSVMIYDEATGDYPYPNDGTYYPPRPRHPR